MPHQQSCHKLGSIRQLIAWHQPNIRSHLPNCECGFASSPDMAWPQLKDSTESHQCKQNRPVTVVAEEPPSDSHMAADAVHPTVLLALSIQHLTVRMLTWAPSHRFSDLIFQPGLRKDLCPWSRGTVIPGIHHDVVMESSNFFPIGSISHRSIASRNVDKRKPQSSIRSNSDRKIPSHPSPVIHVERQF